MIIFENIETKETIGISRESGGKYYRAKLSAVMNSSNLSPNADRGQDFGWRLAPEQQALIEQWESDPQIIDRVSNWSNVMVDDLTHSEFLAYLLHQQELGTSSDKAEVTVRREAQRDYEARVNALRVGKVEHLAPFENKRAESTLENFLNGDLDDNNTTTEDALVTEESLAELDKVIDSVESENSTTPPSVEPPVVGVDPAKVGADKTVETTVEVKDGKVKSPATDGKTTTAKKPTKK